MVKLQLSFKSKSIVLNSSFLMVSVGIANGFRYFRNECPRKSLDKKCRLHIELQRDGCQVGSRSANAIHFSRICGLCRGNLCEILHYNVIENLYVTKLIILTCGRKRLRFVCIYDHNGQLHKKTAFSYFSSLFTKYSFCWRMFSFFQSLHSFCVTCELTLTDHFFTN